MTLGIDLSRSYTIERAYDGLGRPTSVVAGGITTLYDYETILEGDLTYRLDKVSTPFASGETYFWASTKYDALGRPWTATAPDGTVTTSVYDGLQTTITDANGNQTTTVSDILGRTVSVDAPSGPDLVFEYNDLGNMKAATRGSTPIGVEYDLGGRKTSVCTQTLSGNSLPKIRFCGASPEIRLFCARF